MAQDEVKPEVLLDAFVDKVTQLGERVDADLVAWWSRS